MKNKSLLSTGFFLCIVCIFIVSVSYAQSEKVSAVTHSGKAVFLEVPQTSIFPEDVGVLVNQSDPQSVAVAEYYMEKRGIPQKNKVVVDFDPGAVNMSLDVFNEIKAQIDELTPENVQVYAVTWTEPWMVNSCMSMTSAIALGYDADYCKSSRTQPVDYYTSQTVTPFDDLGIRPAMVLGGTSFENVKQLIDRSLLADQTFPVGDGYFMITKDTTRNVRKVFYPDVVGQWDRDDGIDMELFNNEGGSSYNNFIRDTDNMLFYFVDTASIDDIDTNQYLPGAVADHLTSYGGRLTNGISSQMSVLRWLEAGVSGSYGTAIEPYAVVEKFPQPWYVVSNYFSGNTLVEAYWKSVQMPGEGIFVGDPLTRPYGTQIKPDEDEGFEIKTSILIPGYHYALLGSDETEGDYSIVQDGIVNEHWTVTSIKVPKADYTYYKLQVNDAYIPKRINSDEGAGGTMPDISGDLVAWKGTYLFEYPYHVFYPFGPIFLHSLSTGNTIQISTADSVYGEQVRVSGDLVVWETSSAIYGCVYDSETQTCPEQKIMSNLNGYSKPAVSQRNIVWSAAETLMSTKDIFYCDYSQQTCAPIAITDTVDDDVEPDVFGDWVVWRSRNAGLSKIMISALHDGSPVTIAGGEAGVEFGAPRISGDRVIWERCENAKYDLYTCVFDQTSQSCSEPERITTQSIEPDETLTCDQMGKLNADISGKGIVWQQDENANQDIMLYNTETQEQQRISYNIESQEDPAIFGENVVWVDGRNFYSLGVYAKQIPELENNVEVSGVSNQTEPEEEPEKAVCSVGDFDGDGEVGELDFFLLKEHYGRTGCDASNEWCSYTDADRNGKVNIFDFIFLKKDYGLVVGECERP